MNHTTPGIVVIVIILANLIMGTFAITTTAFSAFAKSKDAIPAQKNNQDLIQNGRDSVAANIATNVICASPGPCIVE
jgi:cytochrome b